jgi:hypothetical protein
MNIYKTIVAFIVGISLLLTTAIPANAASDSIRYKTEKKQTIKKGKWTNINYNGKILVTLPKKIITESAAAYSAMTLDVELGNEVGYKYKNAPKNTYNENNNQSRIDFSKKIIVFEEEEAMMLTLHSGNLKAYLDSIESAG